MAEDLTRLEQDSLQALKWTAAEFNYTRELHEILEKIRTENPKQTIEDLKKAFNLIYSLGKVKDKADQGDKRLLGNLKKIEEILPTKWKELSQKLVAELNEARRKLLALVSRFTERLTGELKKIRDEEGALAYYEQEADVNKIGEVKKELTELIKVAEEDIKDLLNWITSTEKTLNKIEKGFVEKLKQLSEE